MAFIDLLNSLLEEKKISRNKFCTDLDIGKNSVANWENRGNTPDGEVLTKIAAYFDVTTDYLLGREERPQVEVIPTDPEKAEAHEQQRHQMAQESREKLLRDLAGGGLESDETQLLAAFRELSPEGQEIAINQIAALANLYHKESVHVFKSARFNKAEDEQLPGEADISREDIEKLKAAKRPDKI